MSSAASRTPPRQTLLDLFREFCDSPSEALLYDNGYRSWRYTWAQMGNAACAFAERLRAQGVAVGDGVMIWSENRPEWVAAFWGCLLAGAIVVPVDYRSSAGFVQHVQSLTAARLILVGEEVDLPRWHGQPPAWPLAQVPWPAQRMAAPGVHPAADDVAEIVYTSGATGAPKGVILSHRNILTNISALDAIVRRYRRWFRPVFPLRFLGLIPLSHMFGQMLTLFFPALIPGSAVFMRGHNPREMVRQIRLHRVSVVIAVPRLLEVLRGYVLHRDPDAAPAAESRHHRQHHWTLRWWRYRRIHTLFGWKFWAFAVGAAPLPADLEAFWTRLAVAVIQGYGLTETSPIIAFNHPFAMKAGTVGKPIPGIEVRLANDTEILVRGPGVTRGYFRDPEKTAAAFDHGWLRTGDTGSFDSDGYLTVVGRKKEIIVTPEGLNVIPEDVEQVLNGVPGVRESAVVGKDRVHAVLVLNPGADLHAIVRHANRQLEEHQKIRSASLWPGEHLPRTESTQKLKHAEILRWVETGNHEMASNAPRSVLDLVQRHAPGRRLEPDTTLDELGLSSLDRVELLMDLQQHFEASVDETWLTGARSLADLEQIIAAPHAVAALSEGRWNRSWWARGLRRAGLTAVWIPLTHRYARVHVTGAQNLAALHGPVLFAANHQSHLDTPVILGALPSRYRHRIAVAMWKEYFDARYHPQKYPRRTWLLNVTTFWLVTFFFHAFVLPQTETGASQSLQHMGELVSQGWSVLLFPEGERTERGEIRPFLPGIGFMAARLQVPVVPIALHGLDRVLHRHARWPQRGPVSVSIGVPLHLTGKDYTAMAAQVEQAVRALAGEATLPEAA